ncbi:hypothetical protein FRB95_013872 [Tulasnella sp. JGI-2019a]|nr:hypothetical protein FRB95_013872 [Tulasnella sp. JGI-2019a]
MHIGLPHAIVQDDVYNGLLIPSATMIFVNAWGILHDERYFPDPFVFNPDRFLASNFPNNADEGGEAIHENAAPTIGPRDVGFGYGRRICQGIPVARTGLWTAMATILASFKIRDPVTPEPILPEGKWTGGSPSAPEPFVCDITPRSQAHADRIREAVAEGSRVTILGIS